MPEPAQHIAVIVHDFATGGSERIAIRLANRWARMGRRVTILCGTEKGAARALVEPGVRVVECTPETTRTPWSRMQLGWRMAALVRQLQPDLVFSPGNFHLIILAFLARRTFSKRPVFVSKLSNPIRRAGLRHWLETLADGAIRLAARPVDGLVAMSPALADEARSVFGSRRVTEVAEPILEDAVEDRPLAGRASSSPLILCAARLARQKDVMTAIRAFAELPPALNARLLILGEGPERKKLEHEASRLGVADRVELAGHVPAIGPYLKRADLYLMTSYYEGYPAVLVEAMAAGVPIVTTNCSLALPEMLVARDLGAIVNSRKPEAIASAIVHQLRQPRPRASASATVVDSHRIGQSSLAYLGLFDSLVHSAGSKLGPAGIAPVEHTPATARSVLRQPG
jgi:glycosyltransferase involved in cell wall biosynthesis